MPSSHHKTFSHHALTRELVRSYLADDEADTFTTTRIKGIGSEHTVFHAYYNDPETSETPVEFGDIIERLSQLVEEEQAKIDWSLEYTLLNSARLSNYTTDSWGTSCSYFEANGAAELQEMLDAGIIKPLRIDTSMKAHYSSRRDPLHRKQLEDLRRESNQSLQEVEEILKRDLHILKRSSSQYGARDLIDEVVDDYAAFSRPTTYLDLVDDQQQWHTKRDSLEAEDDDVVNLKHNEEQQPTEEQKLEEEQLRGMVKKTGKLLRYWCYKAQKQQQTVEQADAAGFLNRLPGKYGSSEEAFRSLALDIQTRLHEPHRELPDLAGDLKLQQRHALEIRVKLLRKQICRKNYVRA